MGILKGNISKKNSAGRGGRFTPEGKHRVKILRCFAKDGKTAYKGDSAGVEFEALNSSNPEVMEAIAKGTATYSWVNNITKQKDAARGNIADFARAAAQTLAAEAGIYYGKLEEIDNTMSDEEFDSFADDEVFGEKGVMAGHEMDVEVKIIKTSTGGDFSLHTWSAPAELLEKAQKAA